MARTIKVIVIAVLSIVMASCVGKQDNDVDDVVEITPSFTDAVHQYDELYPFSEGLAAVKKNDKFGFINTKGELVIPCQYQYAGSFKDGLACVVKDEEDNNISFIDAKGKMLHTKYPFNSYYYLGATGQTYIGSAISFTNGACEIKYTLGDNIGEEPQTVFIDKQIKEVAQPAAESTQSEENLGYEIFSVSDKDIYGEERSLVGVKDKDGKIVIPAKYSNLEISDNGVVLAKIFIESAESRFYQDKIGYGLTVYGYIDFMGKSTFTDADMGKLEGYKEAQIPAMAQLKLEAEQEERQFRIGIGSKDDFGNPYEEWFISDYDCYVDGLYEKLGEYENLDELNYLASKLDELDDHDYNHFQAAMQISDYTGSIKDVINLIDNLDKYEIYPGVESNADLGHYYIEELGMMEVPDYLADYIDYEAYGRDVAINEMGQFTDYGYVRDTQESFTEYYDGDRENIPDEYRVMDFMVSGEKERKTMNYETFKQEFAEDIKEKLYERGYDDVRISFNNVEKTNQNYEAMSVVPEGNNVGVNFNIENAFASYEHTDDYAGVLASATMVIADGLDRAPAIDVSALMDYENMKEKLSVEVISADANADLLANVPHDRMEDLAVVYRFVMESSEDGRASILVTNNLMDRMGVSHEQLRSDALENSPEIRPVVIMGMNEVMKEMMGPEVYEMFGIPDDAEETMYVATVPDKNSGAGVIAYQDFMDQAAERVGGDFFKDFQLPRS